MRSAVGLLLGIVLASIVLTGGSGAPGDPASSRWPAGTPGVGEQDPPAVRPFRPMCGDRWIGKAVAYGPHRDGQRPGGAEPGPEELREDLHLLSGHWGLLRLYGSVGPAERILAIIREDGLDLKVMLGVWIAAEVESIPDGLARDLPEARAANRREVDAAIRLADAYPEIVLAVCVGNETQVFWSAHRVPADLLLGYLREVRTRTDVPVSTADDFNFWNKPESVAVAHEVDFMVVHAHPLWNGILLEDALDWIETTLFEVRSLHPDRFVVLGETGWATRKHDEGEQARLIKGQPGEDAQATFYGDLNAWVERERVPTFFFEAFDENWKGGDHPDDVEKHWGLFHADRTPKKAVAQ